MNIDMFAKKVGARVVPKRIGQRQLAYVEKPWFIVIDSVKHVNNSHELGGERTHYALTIKAPFLNLKSKQDKIYSLIEGDEEMYKIRRGGRFMRSILPWFPDLPKGVDELYFLHKKYGPPHTVEEIVAYFDSFQTALLRFEEVGEARAFHVPRYASDYWMRVIGEQ